MSYLDDVSIAWQNTGNIDAFGRARVSQVSTQLDIKQLHDNQPLFIDEDTNGTGSSSHSTANAMNTLTTAASGDRVILQTKQRFNYQSGKSQLLFWTFNNMHAETNIDKSIGYYSTSTTAPYTADRDGIRLHNDGTDLRVQIARSGTSTLNVAQADWDDPLDGTGASGLTHDFEYNTIMAVDFEWLGVGRVRFYLVIGGAFIQFHEHDFTGDANSFVYMSSPNQPMRWEIRQTGAGSGTLNVICSSVNSEGSINQIGKDGGIGDNGTHLNANNTSTWYVAIALRLNSSKLDSYVDVLSASLKADTTDDYEYRICMNPTYASTLTYTAVTNYAVDYALGAAANTVSAFGSILNVGLGTQRTVIDFDLKSALRIGANIDGTQDEIIVMVRPHSVNLDIHRTINWREL